MCLLLSRKYTQEIFVLRSKRKEKGLSRDTRGDIRTNCRKWDDIYMKNIIEANRETHILPILLILLLTPIPFFLKIPSWLKDVSLPIQTSGGIFREGK